MAFCENETKEENHFFICIFCHFNKICVALRHVVSFRVTSRRVVSCHVMSFRVTSCRFALRRVASCRLASRWAKVLFGTNSVLPSVSVLKIFQGRNFLKKLVRSVFAMSLMFYL